MIRLAHRKSYYLRHPLAAILEAYWDIHYGIRNVFRYLPVIWGDDGGDWSHLMEIMELKLRFMAKSHSDGKITMSWERTAKQLTMASELCRRINNEHYYKDIKDREDWCPPIGPWQKRDGGMFNKTERKCYDDYMSAQDQALLGEMFRKYLRHWWH